MEHYTELISAASALLGALTVLVGTILNARKQKSKQFDKLITMLDAGKPIARALIDVALTMEDVQKKAGESKAHYKIKRSAGH